jgi:hypothetical protein
MDPFAPITPSQENELVDLLTAGRGRNTKDRLRKQLRGVSAGEAETAIRRLKGEPAAPLVVEQPADTATVRATSNALRERLDGAFATRHMQPVGLNKPQGSIR